MSFRRARIKASSAHLATLAGKRRVGAQSQKEEEKVETAEKPKEIENSSPKDAQSIEPVVEHQKEDIEGSKESSQDSLAQDVAHPGKPEKPPSNSEKPSSVSDKPRLKARFRPNLSEADQQRGRLRRISGCEYPGSPSYAPGKLKFMSTISSPFDLLYS